MSFFSVVFSPLIQFKGQTSLQNIIINLQLFDYDQFCLYKPIVANYQNSQIQVFFLLKYTISKAIPTSNQCVWTDNTCIAVTIISTQCGYISGQNLEDTQCSSYNIGCIANVTGTFCQEKKATCNLYINQDNCVLSTAGKCYWNDAAVPPVCISIKTISTDCQLVKGTGLNDTKCSTYHQDCTSISDGTACQEQKNTCDLYLTQSSCTISKASPTANLCIWNSTVTPSKCITAEKEGFILFLLRFF